jgi:hypothetical protein
MLVTDIDDEIVEALAKRRYDDAARLDKYPESVPAWGNLRGGGFMDQFRQACLNGVRADLEAVAPLIRRQALWDAAND